MASKFLSTCKYVSVKTSEAAEYTSKFFKFFSEKKIFMVGWSIQKRNILVPSFYVHDMIDARYILLFLCSFGAFFLASCYNVYGLLIRFFFKNLCKDSILQPYSFMFT